MARPSSPMLWHIALLASSALCWRSQAQFLTRNYAMQRLQGVQHADFRLKLGYRIIDGPGRLLSYGLYPGNTIFRQTFETQFIQDISDAGNLSTTRIFVLNVTEGNVASGWEANTVIVRFRLYDSPRSNDTTTLQSVAHDLTYQAQETTSLLYQGEVTRATDPHYGLVAEAWDVSLLLRHAISVVGAGAIDSSGSEINEGSTEWCQMYAGALASIDGNTTTNITQQARYCQFENWYRTDLSWALNISKPRIQVLFIKNASLESVLVHTRFYPANNVTGLYLDEPDITDTIDTLSTQLHNISSLLYQGNVTARADRTWGLSGQGGKSRFADNPYIRYATMPTATDDYERCKAVNRCNRASSVYNQTAASMSFEDQLYRDGQRFKSGLFDNFEDWRAGTFGWAHRGDVLTDTLYAYNTTPYGAHFSPLAYPALGPVVPTYGFLWNRGLVLDNASFTRDLNSFDDDIAAYQAEIDFMQAHVDFGVLDASARSRADVRPIMLDKINDTAILRDILVDRRADLAVTQCVNVSCTLLFNTSDLTLTGAIDANGTLAYTANGTEVALFSFDSIQLGPELNVTLVGQRALVLTSTSSIMINTTFTAMPGTFGGFPGGYSIARRYEDMLSDSPGDFLISDLGNLNGTATNNINGPGSGSVRVYLYTIRTSASDIDEVHRVSTFARSGQTIGGRFALKYKHYTTRMLAHDATARQVKDAIETDLNGCDVQQRRECDRSSVIPGVGVVNVTRSRRTAEGGYKWIITYRSAIGDIKQIQAIDELMGVGSGMHVETLADGNSMGGSFIIQCFNGATRKLPIDADAEAVRQAIVEKVKHVHDAKVLRTDPTANCVDGLCNNGPTPGYGYTWTLTLTTVLDNISPTSPTSDLTLEEGPMATLRVRGYLTGSGAKVEAFRGHSESPDDKKRGLNATIPFTLAYGGGGGGYGGNGGQGHGHNPTPAAYGDMYVSDLLGGSGGAMGGVDTSIIASYAQPEGRGGAGGGAIELVAMNDIHIGSMGRLVMDAGRGQDGSQYGGGGGAGGAVLLSAGGVIVHEGLISVRGGDGGRSNVDQSQSGGGGAGGRVAMFGQSVTVKGGSKVDVAGGACLSTRRSRHSTCPRRGSDGTYYTWSKLGGHYYVDNEVGAFGTSKSLYLSSAETTTTVDGAVQESPYPRLGPEYKLSETRPERVSFHVRLGPLEDNDQTLRDKQNWDWGAMFALLTSDNHTSTDPLNGQSEPFIPANATIALGISFQETMSHGVNFSVVPWERSYLSRMTQAKGQLDLLRWCKVDILFYWAQNTYDIRVDDVTYVRQATFSAKSFDRIGLYTFPRGEVWFDEIFAGRDSSMRLQCPLIRSTGVSMNRPMQHSWPASALGGQSYNHPMSRWLSFIEQRPEYDFNNGGLVPLDGEAHQAYMSDIRTRYATGDKPGLPGTVMAGVLTHLESTGISRVMEDTVSTSATAKAFWADGDDMPGNRGVGSTGVYYWYGEHDYPEGIPGFQGGVASCSTDDFVMWRFEGIMLHYANITDMVHGTQGPLHVERPKVLYNERTGKYVMWMGVDNANNSLGLAGIAISDYRNGPFDFIRSFYPDGNQSYDQVVFQAPDGTAFLARTFYQDVEYVMPHRVMQPIWQSVRDANGDVDFRLNEHRAYYNPDYDDYNDIYVQRWRKEDQPWGVVCVNRVTGKNRTITPDQLLKTQGGWCTAPLEYKVITGFGLPAVPTRFKDPMDSANSGFVPHSVPGVQAQPWKYNYQDGMCGIHKTSDNYNPLDPTLDSKSHDDRTACGNIADNPPFPTVPDKLIGKRDVVFTRRAKYVAISRLTDDYLDTSGIVTSFEGEMENEEFLVSLLTKLGQFQWGTSDNLGSTYFPQVFSEFEQADDWDRRFHQYEEQYNDRAFYSLACVLDGDCPVNFKDQITVGNK